MNDKIFTFYDVRKRVFVEVAKSDVTKATFKPHNGGMRYALRGVITDGQTATKFIPKEDWDALTDIPMAEQSERR